MTLIQENAQTARAASATRTRTLELVTAALVAALLGGTAALKFDIGAVPVTLQVFFVVLAALLLSPRWAAAAMGLYLALGAIGLPVFSGAKGGFGVLAGPTGGYLFGFFVGAVVGSALRTALASRAPRVVGDVVAALAVIVATYGIGAVQLSLVAGMDAKATLAAGVLPFLVPDAIKAAVAIVAAVAIRRATRLGQ